MVARNDNPDLASAMSTGNWESYQGPCPRHADMKRYLMTANNCGSNLCLAFSALFLVLAAGSPINPAPATCPMAAVLGPLRRCF